jgi:hypothetical protein
MLLFGVAPAPQADQAPAKNPTPALNNARQPVRLKPAASGARVRVGRTSSHEGGYTTTSPAKGGSPGISGPLDSASVLSLARSAHRSDLLVDRGGGCSADRAPAEPRDHAMASVL